MKYLALYENTSKSVSRQLNIKKPIIRRTWKKIIADDEKEARKLALEEVNEDEEEMGKKLVFLIPQDALYVAAGTLVPLK